jgi:SnoaL-like domain
MAVSPAEFAEARQAIEAINAEFAWLIDHCDGAGAEGLFTTEGVYDMSNRVFRGRDEIRGFYDARKARGRRASRHVFSNLHVAMEGPGRATGTTVLTLYACDGDPPYPTQAILIADYNDVYVRDGTRQWRYESRVFVPVFGEMPILAHRRQS